MWAYAARSARGRLLPRLCRCPECGSRRYQKVGTKLLITHLVRCGGCQLLYRIPRDPPRHGRAFYQEAYSSGMATSCPSTEDLDHLLARNFRGTEKDFAHRIQVLRALGVAQGATVLDYGASWGYGVWQFQEAGWNACGYELSGPRSAFARASLDVPVFDDVARVPTDLDVFFSAHVLEHMDSPATSLELARRLVKPGGLFIAITPNGSDACREADPKLYHHSWGRLHGLYLDSRFYGNLCADHPKLLCSAPYGASYDLDALEGWDQRTDLTLDLSNRELLFVCVLQPRAHSHESVG